jgi:hypothetical protein
MKKLGKPKENRCRALTNREREVLGLRTTGALIQGTKDGFDIYDCRTGSLITIADDRKSDLESYWEPSEFVWGNSVCRKFSREAGSEVLAHPAQGPG